MLIILGKANITILEAKDLEGDEYQGAIPLYDENRNLIGTTIDGTWMYYDGEINDKDQSAYVTTIDENGDKVNGFVRSEYYDKVAILDKKEIEQYNEICKVENENNSIVLRNSPALSDENTLRFLENGEMILGTGAKIHADNTSWVSSLYIDGEGNITKGYVRSDDIIDNNKLKKQQRMAETSGILIEPGQPEETTVKFNQQRNIDAINIATENRAVTADGNVVGIDIAALTGNELRELLLNENAIPEFVEGNQTSYVNTADISGKISFAIIQIGATSYGEPFSIIHNDSYRECADVCEELGVPYGFYYYSTANTNEEANEEIKFIENEMKLLGENRAFNLMPFVLDRENHPGSRISGLDGTEVVAYEINELRDRFAQVQLYAGGPDLVGENQIIDLNRLNELVDGEPVEIWFPATRTGDGKINRYSKDYIRELPSANCISMVQTVIDASFGVGERIDLDTVTESNYIDMLNGRQAKQTIILEEENTIENDELEL